MSSGLHWRIVAPSGAVNRERVERTIQLLKAGGHRVSLGEHMGASFHALGFAGRDAERASDLMEALADPDVDVVVAARGGYGAMRILDKVNWDQVGRLAPKPVVGFSDITALHLALGRIGWPTIHGPNAESDWSQTPTRDSLFRLLNGHRGPINPYPLTLLDGDPGSMTASWCGGNLTLVASLMGTAHEPDWTRRVLYLEEVNEAPYRIDRMLVQLRLAGVFEKVQGVVFGDLRLPSGEGSDVVVQDILKEVGATHHIPVWWGLPSGHSEPIWSLPLGRPLSIDDQGWVTSND